MDGREVYMPGRWNAGFLELDASSLGTGIYVIHVEDHIARFQKH